MNFELSLPLIWLVIFDVLAFGIMIAIMYERAQHSAKVSERFQKSGKKRIQSRATSSEPAQATQPLAQSSRAKLPLVLNLPGLSDRRFFLLAWFPLYLTISVLWSSNPVRGLLTAGVMWAVFFAVFAILYILPFCHPPVNLRRTILKSLLISSVLVCIFCFVQSILDAAGWSRESTLLCAGCTSWSFGFPHPSGFAIEPQFMGNLLLAPTLVALHLIVFRSEKQISLRIVAIFLALTLFFTLSRGAIYAFAVALLVLLIFAISKKTFRWSLITIPVVSFVLALGLQGMFAEFGPTSETFTSGITKSIHQLSLGIIDLRPLATEVESAQPVENSSLLVEKSDQNVENNAINCGKDVQNNLHSVENISDNVENSEERCAKLVQNPTANVENSVENPVEISSNSNLDLAGTTGSNLSTISGNEAIFEGYVPESTNFRLALNQAAVQTWLDAPSRAQIKLGADCDQPYSELCTTFTPASILFGVGLGGAGTAMHAQHPDIVTSPKEIVQNEGFSLLLESGLVGIALLILEFLICFCPKLFSAKFLDGRAAKVVTNDFWQHPALPLLCSLIIAYLITLNFFSGLPNALQIYLMPPLLYLVFQPSQTTSAKSPSESQH